LIDGNLDETSDYRADFTNYVAVAMSGRLALKASLQLLYDNEPSLGSLQLFTSDGVLFPGTFVVAPVDDLDSIFTVSLVMNF